MAFLYQIKANDQPQCWTVNDKPIVMGRGDFADAYVEDDSLSRSHFLVIREKHEFFVIDLHSSNGTWVDGEQVSARKLRPTEIIQAGDSQFYFSLHPVAADALPRPLPFGKIPAAPTGSELNAA